MKLPKLDENRRPLKCRGGFPLEQTLWPFPGRLLVLFLVLALVSGCGRKTEPDTLVLYAAGPRGLAEWMGAEFERRNGCHVQLYSATTGEIMAKLQAEQFRSQADVVILASQTAAEVLKDEKMLAPLPAMDGLPMRAEWTDRDHYYSGTAACALGIAVRKEHYDPAMEWKDIFAGDFKGSVVMPSPSQSGSSEEFVMAFHLAQGERFWEGLKVARKRGLQIVGPNSQALTSLVLGSKDAVLAAADYLVFKQIEKGEPLVMHFPASGCPVVPRPVAIIQGSKHERAAREFVRFCFSPEAQERIASEHLIPADLKTPLSACRRDMAAIAPLPFDAVVAKKEQRSVLHRFVYDIERSAAD